MFDLHMGHNLEETPAATASWNGHFVPGRRHMGWNKYSPMPSKQTAYVAVKD